MFTFLNMLALLIFATVLAVAFSNCDNACSGHGTCMTDDVCNCYDNWGVGMSHDSGDCSDRICPYEIAWVDNPNKQGAFHKYAECAGRGICDRTIGECQCFAGYEGKACARASCPNDCSGQGTCEYIQDLGFAANHGDYSNRYFSDFAQTFPYIGNWDDGKMRACVCDATFGDIDCSKRMCPYGTDVLDVRNDLLLSAKYQVQTLSFLIDNDGAAGGGTYFQGDYGTAGNYDALNGLQDDTFAITFTSRLNETFTTIPISFDPRDLPDLCHDIQLALLSLPNKVIDGITVAAGTGLWSLDAAVTPSVNSGYGTAGKIYNQVMVNITFTGPSVQGPQHMLQVQDYECSSGCTPKISGLNLNYRYNHAGSNSTELQLSDFNSYECGRRGTCDYTTGLCQCYTGYTGDNCNTLTTLV